MSLDLAWNELDGALASRLVELLNHQLSSVERPSFIGPVEVTGLDFGTVCPDVEIVDIRDIYRDFLEDDEDSSDADPAKVTERVARQAQADDDDFEWISRRAASHGMASDAPAYHHLPPHMRYGRAPALAGDYLTSLPGMHSPRDLWSGSMSVPNLMDLRPGSAYAPPLRTTSATNVLRGQISPFISPDGNPVESQRAQLPLDSTEDDEKDDEDEDTPAPVSNRHPDLQLHLRMLYHADLRLSLTTSLLINYPSPMFMSLPIKLSVVGLVFDGEVIVAYEGLRRRIHLCILDDLDPYGPAGERPKRDSASSTPPERSDADGDGDRHRVPATTSRSSKPLPVGQRLLPSISIESEIGHMDEKGAGVLKNVTRVERFIQDVIRKTVEDELVFPNFHTLILGD